MGNTESTSDRLLVEDAALSQLALDIGKATAKCETLREEVAIARALSVTTSIRRTSASAEARGKRRNFRTSLKQAEMTRAEVEEQLQLVAFELKSSSRAGGCASDALEDASTEFHDTSAVFHELATELRQVGAAGMVKPALPKARPRPSSIAKSRRLSRRMSTPMPSLPAKFGKQQIARRSSDAAGGSAHHGGGGGGGRGSGFAANNPLRKRSAWEDLDASRESRGSAGAEEEAEVEEAAPTSVTTTTAPAAPIEFDVAAASAAVTELEPQTPQAPQDQEEPAQESPAAAAAGEIEEEAAAS